MNKKFQLLLTTTLTITDRQALSGPTVQRAIWGDAGYLLAAGADHPCETDAAVY